MMLLHKQALFHNYHLHLSAAASLTQYPSFGIGSTTRKKLGLYSYKLGKTQQHKNPHALPLG